MIGSVIYLFLSASYAEQKQRYQRDLREISQGHVRIVVATVNLQVQAMREGLPGRVLEVSCNALISQEKSMKLLAQQDQMDKGLYEAMQDKLNWLIKNGHCDSLKVQNP